MLPVAKFLFIPKSLEENQAIQLLGMESHTFYWTVVGLIARMSPKRLTSVCVIFVHKWEQLIAASHNNTVHEESLESSGNAVHITERGGITEAGNFLSVKEYLFRTGGSPGFSHLNSFKIDKYAFRFPIHQLKELVQPHLDPNDTCRVISASQIEASNSSPRLTHKKPQHEMHI
ncbi:hypothetical protein PHET_05054 [Paragonimus heterotremus]|uniref:Uncharacterized protein n=1 Tax=Paragonimus heterotremus TaxID=100268 RepID=A0A8J4TLG3_9TREM|nr:hypothetical protein PHET_05054 [Paragonimus heterotremus]